ncbi:hypothetical protein HDV00_012682, partial [Rhizophlyctis rosea]
MATICSPFVLPDCPAEDLKYLAVHIIDATHGTVSTKLGDHVIRFLDMRDTILAETKIDIANMSGETLSLALPGRYGWASSGPKCNKFKRCAQVPKDVHDDTERFRLKNIGASGLAQKYLNLKELDPNMAHKMIDAILYLMSEPTCKRWGDGTVKSKFPVWDARTAKYLGLKVLNLDPDECTELMDKILPPERMDHDKAIAACKTAHSSRTSDAESRDSDPSESGENDDDEDAGKGKGKHGEVRPRRNRDSGYGYQATTTVWTPLSQVVCFDSSSVANVDVFSASFDNRTSSFLSFTTKIASYARKDPAMYLFTKNSAALNGPPPKAFCQPALRLIDRLTSFGDLNINLIPGQCNAHTIVPLMGRRYLSFLDLVDSHTEAILAAFRDTQGTLLFKANWGTLFHGKLVQDLGVTTDEGDTTQRGRGGGRRGEKKAGKESGLSKAIVENSAMSSHLDLRSRIKSSFVIFRYRDSCPEGFCSRAIIHRDSDVPQEDTTMAEAEDEDRLADVLASAATELEEQRQQPHDPMDVETAEILQQLVAQAPAQSQAAPFQLAPSGSEESVTAGGGEREVEVPDPDHLFKGFKNGALNNDLGKMPQGSETDVQMNR